MSSPSLSTTGEYVPDGIRRRLWTSARNEGLLTTGLSAAAWGASYLAGPRVARARRGSTSFRLDGTEYPYLDSRHRWTWLNERAVEVPVVADALGRTPGASVLELGNVLAQYGHAGHRVIDRYDTDPEVENLDVLDLPPDPSYDLVISISTLEHVRWDERPQDPEAARKAVECLKQQLSPGGRLLATIPVGYHPVLERQAVDGTAGFDRVVALARTGKGNTWAEIAPEEALARPYDWLVYSAGAVLFAEFTRPGDGSP